MLSAAARGLSQDLQAHQRRPPGQATAERLHQHEIALANASVLAGFGESLAGRLLILDALAMRWREVRVTREYRVRHAAGHFVRVQDRAMILRGPDGRVARLVGCAQDVTALRTAEERTRFLADCGAAQPKVENGMSFLYHFDMPGTDRHQSARKD